MDNAFKPVTPTQMESSLQRFIAWALQQSLLEHKPQDDRLYLLNCAWEAQKLLWQLRQQFL